MEASQYLSLINAPGVATHTVEWQTQVTPSAAHKAKNLRKVTTAMVMTGVEYKNLAVNNDRETGDLPWGEWIQAPYLIGHKGTEYARLNVIDGTVRTVYLCDGDVIHRDEFLSYLTPSQRNAPKPHGGTITVKLSNVRLIGVTASVA